MTIATMARALFGSLILSGNGFLFTKQTTNSAFDFLLYTVSLLVYSSMMAKNECLGYNPDDISANGTIDGADGMKEQ